MESCYIRVNDEGNINFNFSVEPDKAELFVLLLKEITDLQQYNVMKNSDCFVREGIHSIIDGIVKEYNNNRFFNLNYSINEEVEIINTLTDTGFGKIIDIDKYGRYIIEYTYQGIYKTITLSESQLEFDE